MLAEGRTAVERNSIIPILKITVSFTESPKSFQTFLNSILLQKIIEYIEIAEEFGGRIMTSEEYPKLEKDEKVGASIQLIFQDDRKLEGFRSKLNL